jgi:RHS repeat-associated protein
VRTIADTNGSAAQYRYDAFGNVQELDLTSNVSNDTRSERRYGSLFHCRKDAGTGSDCVMSRNIPGPDGSVASLRGPGGPWVFQFGEQRGNRFFTDQNGAFIQDVDFDPYGKPTSSGAQPGNRSFTSEQWNGGDSLAAFGISQLGARLYDPAIGRFLSRDPLFIPRTATTTNPYAFAFNDPVNLSDPSGLDALCVEIGHSQDCTIIERPGDLNPTPFLTWNISQDWDISFLGAPNYWREEKPSFVSGIPNSVFTRTIEIPSFEVYGAARGPVADAIEELIDDATNGFRENVRNIAADPLEYLRRLQSGELFFEAVVGQAKGLIRDI